MEGWPSGRWLGKAVGQLTHTYPKTVRDRGRRPEGALAASLRDALVLTVLNTVDFYVVIRGVGGTGGDLCNSSLK